MAGESAAEMARRQREKARRLDRSADMWEQGAHGEEATAKALETLPKTWRVIHDVRWPGRRFANIDHVAVGPGGVFVIDSKAWSGQITVNDSVLLQNGRRREREVAAAADAALAVAERLSASPHLVHPVLCIVNEDQLSVRVRDVTVCGRETIRAALESAPPLLPPRDVAALAARISTEMTPAMAARSTPTTRVRSIPRPPARRSRKRKGPGLGDVLKLVVFAVVAIWFLSALPKIAHQAGHLASPAGTPESISSSPSTQLGTHHRLPPATNRPPLMITADRFKTTRSLDSNYYVSQGNRVVAVRVTVRNLGKRTWVSQPGTTASMTTEFGPRPAYAGIRTAAGRVWPGAARLRPGHTLRGYIVTQLSQNEPITGFSFTVGPGQPAMASWAIDRQ